MNSLNKDAHRSPKSELFFCPQGGSLWLLGIGIILIISLCGLSFSGCAKTEMTEDWQRITNARQPINCYHGGRLYCGNCVWHSFIYVRKGVSRDTLDFSEFVCPYCKVKGIFELK